MANVRYTIGKIVRKEGCWRGEKGSKVQGGARLLLLHSTNFTAPIKYKYRTAQQMQRNDGERAHLVRSSNTNMSDKYQPQSITTQACLCLLHLRPVLIDAARGRGVTRRPGAASRHGGSEATISSHRHQSPLALARAVNRCPPHTANTASQASHIQTPASTLALASY